MKTAVKLMFALIACAAAGPAAACTCRRSTPGVKFAAGSSTEVFLAEVLDMTRSSKSENWEVALQTHAVWKGSVAQKITVHGGGMCGFQFKKGNQYLIYSRSMKDQIVVSMCSRTMDYSRATDDIQTLGAPKWKSSPDLVLLPKVLAGLSVEIAPLKRRFSQWDDIGFDVTLHNKSNVDIALPANNAAPNLLELVVYRDGAIWSTVNGLTSRKNPDEVWPTSIHPGESRVVRIDGWERVGDPHKMGPLRISNLLRNPGEHSVAAVVHFSTSTPGLWSGYLFSEPTTISLYQKQEDAEANGTPN